MARHAPFVLALTMLGLMFTPGRTCAADPAAEASVITKVWNRYAELSSQDKPESADLLAASSLAHFAFLRDAAIYASPEQVRRIPLSDRLLVYLLRANRDDLALKAMDGRAVAMLCMEQGWCGVSKPEAGEELLTLTLVTVVGDLAVGEYGPPTETQFQFGPEFARENGIWRLRYESMANDASAIIQRAIQQAGAGTEQMLEAVMADLGKGQQTPPLAILDRALVDDAAARMRLNETWPKYDAIYAARIRAIEEKARQGDAFAQYVLGAVLYSGVMPAAAAQDKVRGLALLEQASDAGNARAAAGVIEALQKDYVPVKGKPVPADKIAKLARHARRAAEGGMPGAMLVYSGLLFNGAGGLTRDCVQAEEWAARAEDGGIARARNERVWVLATCPIPAQRNPARALELAGYMVENAGTLPASDLDTVAAAMAANGRFTDAIDYQRRALDKLGAGAGLTRKGMQQRLETYRRGKDWIQDYDTYALPAE